MEAPPYRLQRRDLDEAASEFRQVYPFSDFDPAVQRSYLDTVERFETLKHFLGHIGTQCCYYDSLVLALNILKTRYIKSSLSFYFFMDCLGSGGAACNLAFISGIHNCLSIEASSESKTRSVASQQHIGSIFSSPPSNALIRHKVGSMQDYFDFEANIVFISTLEAAGNPLVDEARLLLVFLRLTKRLEPSAFVIIMTRRIHMALFVSSEIDAINHNLDGLAGGEMFLHLRELFRREEDGHNAYLFQVVSDRPQGKRPAK